MSHVTPPAPVWCARCLPAVAAALALVGAALVLTAWAGLWTPWASGTTTTADENGVGAACSLREAVEAADTNTNFWRLRRHRRAPTGTTSSSSPPP